MDDFVTFGNIILRRDAIESITPVVVGGRMVTTITMKSGNWHSTEYVIGRDRFNAEYEFKKAWSALASMLGQELPRLESSSGAYHISRPFRTAAVFLFRGVKGIFSPALQILKLLKP